VSKVYGRQVAETRILGLIKARGTFRVEMAEIFLSSIYSHSAWTELCNSSWIHKISPF